MRSRMRLRPLAAALVLALAAALPGCARYAEDRCWVSPEKYAVARDIFITTGSLSLVELHMQDMQWLRCEQNETLYRLSKEFEVLPEEIPPTPEQPL